MVVRLAAGSDYWQYLRKAILGMVFNPIKLILMCGLNLGAKMMVPSITSMCYSIPILFYVSWKTLETL